MLDAPDISEVYKHYRGEYLPDGSFFEHALVDKFSIPAEKVGEFTEIFLGSLQSAKLVEKKDDKYHVPHVSTSSDRNGTDNIKKLSAGAKISEGDPCFIVTTFCLPNRRILPTNL